MAKDVKSTEIVETASITVIDRGVVVKALVAVGFTPSEKGQKTYNMRADGNLKLIDSKGLTHYVDFRSIGKEAGGIKGFRLQQQSLKANGIKVFAQGESKVPGLVWNKTWGLAKPVIDYVVADEKDLNACIALIK